MRALLSLATLATLAVAAAVLAKPGSGYALLVYPPYRVELSLVLLLVLLAALFALAYALLRLALRTARMPAYVRAYRSARARERGRQAWLEAELWFAEGRHARAEQSAVRALDAGESPLVCALLAARAAHAQKAFERRDAYFVRAEKLDPQHPLPRLITQAELLLDERLPAEALAVIRRVYELAPRHPVAQRLELRAQQLAKNWEQVLALVASLEKREVLEPVQAEQVKTAAYLETLRRKSLDAIALREAWQKVPAEDKAQSQIALAAARAFNGLGESDAAVAILENSLARHWDEDLVRYYGECGASDPMKQIERAEKWLAAHPNDAELLLALGKLCARQSLWGKSQTYLEASLSVSDSAAAHVQLARLMEHIERPEAAFEHYRKSMALGV